jgi:hypothetical protein
MIKLSVIKEEIEKFQCPGCVCGHNSNCGKYAPDTASALFSRCKSHVIGTSILGGNGAVKIALGLPKGFNRFVGTENPGQHIRIWDGPPMFNLFNVPVWYMDEGEYYFVRTFVPRLGISYVDVFPATLYEQVKESLVGAKYIRPILDEMD